jgi:protein involved in polysaccharide export with SLBB domain
MHIWPQAFPLAAHKCPVQKEFMMSIFLSALVRPLSLLGFVLALCSTALAGENPQPFGTNLFQGNFTRKEVSPAIGAGDRFVVRLWQGGLALDDTLTVDGQGNLDLSGAKKVQSQQGSPAPADGSPANQSPADQNTISQSPSSAVADSSPALGLIPVGGIAADKLADTLKSKLAAAGYGQTQVYAAPLDSRPVNIFITGGVAKPGWYSGSASDPVLAFLDKAGGIDVARGSFRDISLVRNAKKLAQYDLYPFVRTGALPSTRLQDGDTLVVGQRGACVMASGKVRTAARFEFLPGKSTGAALLELAEPEPSASHVTLTGTRNNAPYSTYLPIAQLKQMTLSDGDSLVFSADASGDTIMIAVQGAVRGASRFPVRRGTKLSAVRQYIAVQPERANIDAMYIKRPSVAARQKKAIEASLQRLQESSLTASSSSTEESQIRAKEAEMVAKFVEHARLAEPEGVVVLRNEGKTADIALEDGDTIIIPVKSDVVLVSGEVMMPQALVWHKNMDIDDYVKGSGGYSARADQGNVLILRQDGSVGTGDDDIHAGDQVMVLPRVQSKSLQLVKDLSQVLMQVTVSARMLMGLPSL